MIKSTSGPVVQMHPIEVIQRRQITVLTADNILIKESPDQNSNSDPVTDLTKPKSDLDHRI